MESLLQDLRFGFRMLVKKPGFTLIVVLTLALGIGATTAVFSVIDVLLFKPLPYLAPERLMVLARASDKPGERDVRFWSYPVVAALRFSRQKRAGFPHSHFERTRCPSYLALPL